MKQMENEMIYTERCKIYKRAIANFGGGAQVHKALEEFAELQDALLKYLGDRDTLEHLAEEIADATIMVEQLRLMFDVNERVKEIMNEKLRRLEQKVEANTVRV